MVYIEYQLHPALQANPCYLFTNYFNTYLEYLKYCKPYIYVFKGARKQFIHVAKRMIFHHFSELCSIFCITISLVSKMATSACNCCDVHKQQPWKDMAFRKILIGSLTDICQYNRRCKLRAFFLLYLKRQWISFECLWILRTIYTQRLTITIHL